MNKLLLLLLSLTILVVIFCLYNKKENFKNLAILEAIKKDIREDLPDEKDNIIVDPQQGDRDLEFKQLKNTHKLYNGREIESYGSGKILMNPKLIPGFDPHKIHVNVPVVEPKKSMGVSMPENNVYNTKKVYYTRNENVKPIIGQEPHKAHVDAPVVETNKPLAIVSS